MATGGQNLNSKLKDKSRETERAKCARKREERKSEQEKLTGEESEKKTRKVRKKKEDKGRTDSPSRLKPILTWKALTIAVVTLQTPKTTEGEEETASPEGKSDSSEDSVKTIIAQDLGENLSDPEDTSIEFSMPEEPRRTDPEEEFGPVRQRLFSFDTPVMSPQVEEDSIEELERLIDRAYHRSLGQGELEWLDLESAERETERAKLGLERVKQGSYQLEQDLITNSELEQELALLKKEKDKITRE